MEKKDEKKVVKQELEDKDLELANGGKSLRCQTDMGGWRGRCSGDMSKFL